MAAEIREHLLRPPPHRLPPHRPPPFTTTGASAQRPFIPAPDFPDPGRGPLFPVNDFKKRGQGLRSWVRIDAATGESHILDVDKFSMMRRCDLPARDLRLLDPVFVYPSTILGRERAIVVSLEQIRCIITADEILLLVPPNELHLLNSPSESHLLNSSEGYVKRYVMELQRRLTVNSGEDGVSPPDNLPFEFLALEVAFEAACTFLDGQAVELESEAYPVLDELAVKISTLNLERVRRLKSRLVALTRRVQKVRDEIEQLMDDDGDMAEMYLTEKKRQMEASLFGEQSLLRYTPGSTGISVSAPVSPVSSPPGSRKLEKSLSTRSRIGSSASSYSNTENIEELEMLLEAFFVVSDSILYKLNSLKEYIDDTEDFINIQLDNVRNQLMQFELLLSTATFIVAIFGVVAGIFGMNFDVDIFRVDGAFQWVLVITGLCGLVIFCSFLWFFRYRRLLQL